jgi:hypothetical protein
MPPDPASTVPARGAVTYAAGVDDDIDDPIPTVPKPDELLALHSVTAELFATLRRWFAVPRSVAIDLAEIDSAVAELGDPLMIAALAMRKLQALHLLSTPGVMTTSDVVITIVQDLDRALVQAPNMHLKLQAAATDWDAELAELDAPPDPAAVDPEVAATRQDHPAHRPEPSVPIDPNQVDPETERFRLLHAKLHEAAFAVIELSDGEIRYLV